MTVAAPFTEQIEADIARAAAMFIDGEWVSAASREILPVFDPADGQVIAHVPA